MRRAGALVVAAVLCGGAATAWAGRVAVLEVRAEAELDEQAGALTLLLRSAIDRPGHPVVAAPELARVALPIDVPVELARGMASVDAELVVACDLSRVGTSMVASILAVDRSGAVVAAGSASAGEGDAVGLARGIVAVLEPAVGTGAVVPAASVGQLRPYVTASRALARGDLAAAAAAAGVADPVVALRVRAIGPTLAPGWAGAAADQTSALAIAQVAATPKDVLDLAPGTSGRERAARALARLQGAALDEAARELAARGPKDPWLDVAAARLAHARGDRAGVSAAVTRLLAVSPPFAPGVAVVAALPGGAVAPALEDRALAQARSLSQTPRLASVLGLRVAARGTYAALASVRAIDLDDTECRQLEPIATQAAAAGNRDGLRLVTELAARRADASAVSTAVQVWLAAAVDDPNAQLFRGRLALAALRLDEARDSFTAARAERELARVWVARGDLAAAEALLAAAPDDSVDKQVVALRRAIERGDTAAADVTLARVRRLAPASPEVLAARAVLAERRGDAPAAAADRTLVERLGGKLTTVDLSRPTATTTAVPPPAATTTTIAERASRLEREMTAMLPPLSLDRGAAIAIVGVRGPRPAWWSLREAVPGRLGPALTAAVRAAGLTVIAANPAWIDEPIDVDRLSTLAADVGATHLLLYRLEVSGSQATVRLIYFEKGVANARAFEAVLDGRAVGLVRWKRDRFVLLGGLAAVILVFVVATVIRGRSRIVVTIERDPDGSEEVLAIEVSRSRRRPTISDPAAFRKDTLRTGHQQSDSSARLPSDRTVFRVSPGTWWVHVYGVYTREYGDRVVPPMHSREIEVKRGAMVQVAFDLGLPVAEVKITIHDEKRQGIAVWLDDGHADRVYTDAGGQVVLYATVGMHTLHIDPGDLRIDKPLPIAAAKIEKVIINLPRERRLAEVSDGLTLAPTEHGPASTPVVDRTIGDRLAEAAVAPPPPVAPVVIATPVAAAPTQLLGAPPAAAAVTTTADSQRITNVTDAVVASTLAGRYRLDAELGAGAMGVVYRAWDLRLERAVAVKVMARAVREIPQALEFFISEAKALAQLNHPNIVAVYDQVSDGLEHCMVMEFVDGITLEKLLTDRGRLSVRQALGVIDQLCTGLAYAHGKKVIHRDIKPANIFISREKVVKLGDFGLARVMREIEIRQTDIRGTPLYMAPEQVSGTNINHRADLYAVGCTLFELCAGRPPFIDGNVMHHHLVTEPPVLSSLCPEAPPALDRLVADCLAKDAVARVDSAAVICQRARAIAAAL